MTWANYDHVRAQIEAAGILLDRELQIGTTRPVRCKVEGDREKRGWYRLYDIVLRNGDSLIVGSYGIWRGDDNGATKIEIEKGRRAALDTDQMAAIKARQLEDAKRAEAERQREIDTAARRASLWWADCIEQGESAYLKRKGLPPGRLYGARLSPAGNLVIPLQDGRGNTFGLQVIYHDPKIKARKGRDKDYGPPGLSKKGHWFQIGSPLSAGGIVLVCEGFATGASLHESTGLPVAVAFDAGNLGPVCEALKKLYRGRLKQLICADDDYLQTCRECKEWTLVATQACTHCGHPHGKENAGVMRAQTAALAVDGAWVKPTFPEERPLNRKGPTDFNDLHVARQGGASMVQAQIDARISALGWRIAPVRASDPNQGGAGHGAGQGGRKALKPMLTIWEAQERFAFVYGGKGTLFDFQEHALVPKADVLDILPEHGWRDLRDKKRVVRLSEIGFDPAGTKPGITCNLYAGWPSFPVPGKCDIILSVLEYLCSGEENHREIYQWVLKWLAYPIQHPGAKMQTALIFHGPQGVGKNLFFEAVLAIYGEYGRIVDQAAIEDKFNDWASRKLFLIGDEVVARQELFHIKNKLKHFVTGSTIRINPKNVSPHDEDNHVNVVFLSNEHKPLILEKLDRRYAVVWTPCALPGTTYAAAAAELKAGGVAALHHYLWTLDLGDFNEHTKPPMTAAKRSLIDTSLGSLERFQRDWENGDTPHPFCPCGSGDLYQAYRRWCQAHGESKPRPSNEFVDHFNKQAGWRTGHRDRYDGSGVSTKRQRMIEPSPEALANAAKSGRKSWLQPPEQSVTRWLTDAYFAFHDSMGGPDAAPDA